MKLVGHLDVIGEQPCAFMRNIGDQAVARQRAVVGLQFGDPVDGVATMFAPLVEHDTPGPRGDALLRPKLATAA